MPDEINFGRYVFIVTSTALKRKAIPAARSLPGKKPDEVIIGFGNEEFDREDDMLKPALTI